jgi:hypothetical protein
VVHTSSRQGPIIDAPRPLSTTVEKIARPVSDTSRSVVCT